MFERLWRKVPFRGTKRAELAELVRNLEQANREIAAKLAAMTAEASELWTIRHSSDARIASQSEQLRQSLDAIASAEDANRHLKQENQHLHTQLSASHDANRELKQENQHLHAQLSATSDQVKGLEKKIELEVRTRNHFLRYAWYYRTRTMAMETFVCRATLRWPWSKAGNHLAAVNARFDSKKTFQGDLIQASGLFDPDFYTEMYPDAKKSKLSPVEHYLSIGAVEGRSASSMFDGHAYLATNTDVAQAKMNPLLHFINYGVFEERAKGPGDLLLELAQTQDYFPKP